MISTKDLMIGNWVYMEAHRGYEAQYIQVETIPDASSKDHYGHIGAFPVGGDNDFRDIEDRHLFPIPLTAAILEKNFPTAGELAWWPVEDGLHCESRNTDDIMVSGVFRFVHQLQHALRLCGIEHEITL